MKVIVTKLGGFRVSKTHISFQAVCVGQDIKLDDISMGHKATLCLGETRLRCTVTRATKNENGAYDFFLSTLDSLDSCNAIHPYHHKSNLNLPLLLRETVDPALLSEVGNLLDELSRKEHRSRGELLYELTQFKDVKGKRDLNLVTATQMPVVKDKILKRLEPRQSQAGALA